MSTQRNDRRAALRRALQAYAPALGEERAHHARMLQLLQEAEGDPFARDHYVPGHFTASAFVLSPGRTQLLLILHGKLGRWLQPGGHVEPADADLLAAATREAREETGLGDLQPLSDHPFDLDVHDIPPHGAQPGHAHYDVRFLLQARDMRATAASDARDARFFDMQGLLQAGGDASVLRAVRKLAAQGD